MAQLIGNSDFIVPRTQTMAEWMEYCAIYITSYVDHIAPMCSP